MIDDCLVNRIGFLIQNGMGIAVDRQQIFSFFQHIGFFFLVIIGSHIFDGNRHGYCLGLARLQQIGLCKICQIHGRLFNSPIGIRRMVIKFHHILACSISGVGHGYIYGKLSVLFFQFSHLLFKCSIT